MKDRPEADVIVFSTEHLLTKWGFADGELLDNFLRENGYGQMDKESEDWYQFSRRVLCEVVERQVIPRIENNVSPYRMAGSHNPSRVWEADGIHMSDWQDQTPTLRPSCLEIEKKVVLEIAAEIYQSRTDSDGQPVSYMVRTSTAAELYDT